MKKFRISVFLMAVLIGVNFISCNKDDFSEKDAMNLQAQLDKQKTLTSDSIEKAKQLYDDNLAAAKTKVTYTVSLVDAASTTTLKSASVVSGISGATIVLTQNGRVITKTTDANGFAVFDSLKVGHASLNIKLTNYSDVNATIDLNYFSVGYAGGQQLGNVIPMIALSGSSTGVIKGKITAETNLTNLNPEEVANAKVIATVKTSSASLANITNQGIFKSISYGGLSLSGTTDANGDYSLTVPATVMGLDYDIIVSDFTADQKLLQSTYNHKDTVGVVSIPTNFGSSYTSPSSIPSTNAVIVTLGAPDYTFTPAAATAIIDNQNGISNINITNNGSLYTQHSGYTIPIDDASIKNASTSTGTASFDVNSFGRVTNISVSSGGSNYLAAAENFELVIPYVQVEAVVSVTVAGGVVTAASITNPGRYFVNRPEDVTFSYNGGAGSGATFTPSFTYSGNAYTLTSVSVTNGGSGYTNGTQTYNIKSSLAQQAKARLHMTTGFLSAISVTDQGSNYISSAQVDVVISNPSSPSGTTALATATVNNGKISSIAITNAGSGYSSTPTVTIVNKIEKIQAKYTANLSNGQITSFTSVNQGNGYYIVPTVTLSTIIPNSGTGASANATISGGKVTGIALVNGGKNYFGNTPSSSVVFSGTLSANVTGSSTSIVNINLGTGKRTIEQ